MFAISVSAIVRYIWGNWNLWFGVLSLFVAGGSRNFSLARRVQPRHVRTWRQSYTPVPYSFPAPAPIFHSTMASRYGSHLTQREGRSSLFSSYDNRQASTSPSKNRPGSGYSSRYGGDVSANHQSPSAFGAYPNGGPSSASAASQFRTATPDSKGRYSDAVLSELESQNDEHISGILGKVGQLKQVCCCL